MSSTMSNSRGDEARHVADIIRTLQKHLQCVICFEILRDPMTTRCGHTFCQVCIYRVVKGRTSLCPLCNARINRRGIVENEKIRGVVQAVHIIISNAQKDITDMGYEDVLQLFKENTHSNTRNSISPIKHENIPSTSGDQETVSRRSKKVESWLLDVHAPSPSQVSIQSIQPVVNNSANEDSDSEMESVSQINPDQTSRRKPLSAYIEDDCEPQSRIKKTMVQKSKTFLAPKKMGQLNVKAKQESLKGFGALKITPTKDCPKTSKGDIEMKVPDPVVVVLDLDKENTNSPGWSHFKKMKKDFQISPAPSIEDPGSSDEQPCLNLSLDSPVLKKKDRVVEIVNSLQSEIEIFEKSLLPVQKDNERNISSQSKNIKKRLVAPSCSGFSNHQSIVKFLKLGRLAPKKSAGVPFYLKGSLLHLYCTDVTRTPRLLLDAQVQTDSDTVRTPQDTISISLINPADSPLPVLSSPVARRSVGAQSEVDMDAETVLFTQPFIPPTRESGIISPLSVLNEASTNLETEIIECTYPQNNLETEIIECTYPQNNLESRKLDEVITTRDVAAQLEKTHGALHQYSKQSQCSELSSGSLDVIGSPKKTIDLVTASDDIPQVDLDNDSCSSVVPDSSSKRTRPLGSFSDSSDSDVGVSKKQKKKKIQVLSDNENSCSPHNDDADVSIIDTSKIMANIEARLAEEERMQSVGWLNEVIEKNTETVSEAFEDCLDVLSNTSKNQIDSDGDSEVINPTPQKQSSFALRQTTESDDIVPSSQPPVPITLTYRLSPPSLGNNHKDSTGSKPNELPQIHVLESQAKQGNTSEDIREEENRNSSKVPETGQAPEPNLFSDTKTVTEVENAPKAIRLQFVCSSLPGNLVVQVEKLANIVKAEFSPKFTSDTSHLIVRVDESNKADKTLKYLCAVAAGKWVVSFAWVEKCIEAGKLLPEEAFEALDATGEPGPRRSREARLSKKNLFCGFEFCCIGDFPDISITQMQGLLIDCGASMVSKPTDFSFQDHIIPVALAQWDESKEAEYNSWLDEYSTPLVQHEWVLDCIGKFSVTSFSAMLLCDVSEDYLASMGIPSYLFELTESEQ